jgi:hypothetical protein
MTAEIAILNKTAVALASDSAVTISAGMKEEKIFDTADKLFELSNHNPIGIMIYNGMSFMEAPLPSLIRQFRNTCPKVSKVEEAADHFLRFLNDFGKRSPEDVKTQQLVLLVDPILTSIHTRFNEKFQHRVLSSKRDEIGDLKSIVHEILDDEINTYLRVLEARDDAKFAGNGRILNVTKAKNEILSSLISKKINFADDEQKKKLLKVAQLSLRKNVLTSGLTGLVIAGFGDNEIFPTLLSFELDGMICDRLKYVPTNNVDIDRRGTKAKVLPFAQKEMVERFLYGLDDRIQRQIAKFCKETIPDIRGGILDHIQFENEADKADVSQKAQEAEEAFLKGLGNSAFENIRSQSQVEIEDMVEFMPKPELAKMAEALVNLTSIKRRVSRGMETVGGPIDVALISQSEGFVWVKRKHYFPAELNARYFNRAQARVMEEPRESYHGSVAQPRGAGSRRRAKTKA